MAELTMRAFVAFRLCEWCRHGPPPAPLPFAHVWTLDVWPAGSPPPRCPTCGEPSALRTWPLAYA